jgi:hypothetical protein
MQIKTLVTLLSLGVAGISLQAQASSDWYLSPSASYVVNDNNRTKNNGWGVGLAVGKAVNNAWNIEFSSRYLRLDGKKDEMGSVGASFLQPRSRLCSVCGDGLGLCERGIFDWLFQ